MINYKNKYVVIIGLLLVWLLADGINKFLHSNNDFNDASFVLFYEKSLEIININCLTPASKHSSTSVFHSHNS